MVSSARKEATVSEYALREAGDADQQAILDIYNDAVLHSTATFDLEPRTWEGQQRWFQEHRPPFAVFVAAAGDAIAGWGSLSRFRPRPGYRFTARRHFSGGGFQVRPLARCGAHAEDGRMNLVKPIIVDYGAGNLRSVARAVARAGYEPLITSEASAVERAEGGILPGVGAAADTMSNLTRCGLVEPHPQYSASGRPFLGVCMGLPALLTVSEA